MPSDASTMATTTSARRMALRARSTLSASELSALSATLVRFRMPAVSTSFSLAPDAKVTSVSTASRVVPLMSHTITRSSPQIAFSRLLLPTLGRPTIAIDSGGSASSSSPPLGGGNDWTSASSISPVPEPVMALMGMGSRPSSQNSEAMRSAFDTLSHLLTARCTFLRGWLVRSQSNTSRSPACRPALPSTSSTTESASSTPSAACFSIADGRPRAFTERRAFTFSWMSAGSWLASLMRPPVSTTTNSVPPHCVRVYMRSRVMPGWSNTTAILAPAMRLNRALLPTFGRPTIATLGRLSMGSRFLRLSERADIKRGAALPDEDAPGWLRCSALARCSCCFWAALTCWGEEPKGNRLSSASSSSSSSGILATKAAAILSNFCWSAGEICSSNSTSPWLTPPWLLQYTCLDLYWWAVLSVEQGRQRLLGLGPVISLLIHSEGFTKCELHGSDAAAFEAGLLLLVVRRLPRLPVHPCNILGKSKNC
mmetsp:Transcript_429/g.1067  ORF Transcript_429/g.1067 Transcript_429/m.1067 type:complete len:483 (-) Transcript_429:9-1457(-)